MTGIVSNIIFGIVITALNYILINLIVRRCTEKVIRQDESEKVERYRKITADKQKQLDFYRSRCYGAEKQAKLLEDELTKLKTKK